MIEKSKVLLNDILSYLNKSQSKIFLDILDWLSSENSKQIYLLIGHAGTGKSTIISKLNELLNNEDLNISMSNVALSWKAAKVLSTKGIIGTQSIHSLLYTAYKVRNSWRFIKKSRDELRAEYSLIIVDEVSMVPTEIRRDLESYGIKILYVGDNFQLPAIESKSDAVITNTFLSGPDARLTDIVRQEQENAIVKIASDLRNGIDWKPGKYNGQVFIGSRKGINDTHLIKSDVVLCGTNKTRKDHNIKIRRLKGVKNPYNMPTIGEQLMLFSSNKKRLLYNSDIITCVRDYNHLEQTPYIEHFVCLRDIHISDHNDVINEHLPLVYNDVDEVNITEKDYAKYSYTSALTVHKSQGSEFNKGIIIDESYCWSGESKLRWMYTSITRFREKVIIGL